MDFAHPAFFLLLPLLPLLAWLKGRRGVPPAFDDHLSISQDV